MATETTVQEIQQQQQQHHNSASPLVDMSAAAMIERQERQQQSGDAEEIEVHVETIRDANNDNNNSDNNNNNSNEKDNKEKVSYFMVAKEAADDAVNNSMIVDEMNVMMLPSFDYGELGLGKKLGQGSFADIYEINSITLKAKVKSKKSELSDVDGESDDGEDQEHSRKYLSYMSIQNKDDQLKASYALKCIRKDVVEDGAQYGAAICDIVNETYFLSCFNHPHISKILGIVKWDEEDTHYDTPSGQNAGFMIISNRLYSFLDHKMDDWRKRSKTLISKFGLSKDVLRNQTRVALHLAQVFQYLHRLNVVCRDIKPENIGFDMQGELKIFDFGLSAELLPQEKDHNGLYRLSMAGTPQYMAPEVIKDQPYNHYCDVYSYGVVLWEMFVLQKAFLGWTWGRLYQQAHGTHCKLLSKENHHQLPPFVTTLIQDCTAFDWKKRPTFDLVATTLKIEDDKLTKTSNHHNNNNTTNDEGGQDTVKHASLRSFSFRVNKNAKPKRANLSFRAFPTFKKK